MIMSEVKIAVIVVGYNSRSFLKDCFNSLEQSSLRNHIYFVDNHSSDRSVPFVQKNFPKVTIIDNQANVGFAAGNNVAIKAAIKNSYQYLFILNPDTLVDRNCLRNLLDQARSNIILQPMILIHDGRKTNLVNTAGNVLHYLGVSYVGNYREKVQDITPEKNLAIASGAAMLVPAHVFKKIGYFDTDFFMYHEDVDLSWRARINGLEIKLIPSALVWHKYHFSRNKKKFYYVERNRLKFLLKNYQLRTLLLITPIGLINELLVVAHSLYAGWFWYKLRANFDLVAGLGSILATRRKINRVVKDRQLKKYLSAELDFSEVKIPFAKLYNRVLRGYWQLIGRLI